MKHFLLILAAVALVGCASASVSSEQKAIIEKRIRVNIGKPTGRLTNADLMRVEFIILNDKQITDAGLKELAEVKQLKNLHLLNCRKLSADELAKLMKALPNCNINHNHRRRQ